MKKIFNKFKHFSGYIKIFIIGVLVASCFGVYATGTCVISATADDITYGNTTVQAAIDDLYSMTQSYCPPGYECKQLNYVRDCDNNILLPTIPNNLKGLAKIMAEAAYLDNGQSEYVSSCNGVDFSNISSNTNGKGIYEIASTKNNTYPIYYYRGEVENNNVKFAGFCWKAVRTTDSGGVKMIYNGEPDGNGNCSNITGTDTQIGTSKFNISRESPSDVGYMYGTRYAHSHKSKYDLSTPYVFGNNVTYSGENYTLTNTMTTTGTWSNDYNTLSNNHYTCFSTGTTCSSVYYIFYVDYSGGVYYISLTGGKVVSNTLDEMFINTTNSTAKTQIDTWYNTNLSSYTSYIEDTIYCNDRSISDLAGWNPDGGNPLEHLTFYPNHRFYTIYTPTLECNRYLDKFTVSSSIGNGELTYPIGLITVDEVMYAGGKDYTVNSNFYLYTNQEYWTLSPAELDQICGGRYCDASGIFLNSEGRINADGVTSIRGLRPVISLKSTDVVISGDGTQTNPYVISTN